VVLDRQRRRTAEFIAIGAIDIGMAQQPLPDGSPVEGGVADRADAIARLAVLDKNFAAPLCVAAVMVDGRAIYVTR
jgi:hypothetical protein